MLAATMGLDLDRPIGLSTEAHGKDCDCIYCINPQRMEPIVPNIPKDKHKFFRDEIERTKK